MDTSPVVRVKGPFYLKWQLMYAVSSDILSLIAKMQRISVQVKIYKMESVEYLHECSLWAGRWQMIQLIPELLAIAVLATLPSRAKSTS